MMLRRLGFFAALLLLLLGTVRCQDGPEPPSQPKGPEPPSQPKGPEPPSQGPEPPAQPKGPEPPAQPKGPEPPSQPKGPEPPSQGPEPPAQPKGPEPPAQPKEPEPPAQPKEPEPPVDPAAAVDPFVRPQKVSSSPADNELVKAGLTKFIDVTFDRPVQLNNTDGFMELIGAAEVQDISLETAGPLRITFPYFVGPIKVPITACEIVEEVTLRCPLPKDGLPSLTFKFIQYDVTFEDVEIVFGEDVEITLDEGEEEGPAIIAVPAISFFVDAKVGDLNLFGKIPIGDILDVESEGEFLEKKGRHCTCAEEAGKEKESGEEKEKDKKEDKE
ncbi:unnamed protein product [Vitrella brassicaformis CCMP3155]|uniref:Uncharacterized protein n=1 Tax=Vitrella brassicaformis (strain CCMP3155) TaxID=1169540 RepID=A0A0G4EDG2_VITBC|nr:unnamed protein product [Vitrella brassicaformis CCMP3155]|eukprot:CEL93410.1 unnamed protein product [Vitrella brassicaformis CCMP3155]